jgi:hypothetical protein
MEYKLPFDGKNELELQSLICDSPYPVLSNRYSSSLNSVVDKMLMKVFENHHFDYNGIFYFLI